MIAAGGLGPDSIIELFSRLLSDWTLWTFVILGAEIFALLSIVNVIMTSRTAAGAWAWSLALFSFPFAAVPLYWIFGRRHFRGYREKMREAQHIHEDLIEEVSATLEPHFVDCLPEDDADFAVLEALTERRFSEGNEVELLINGEATFDAIFRAIDGARDYILVQFFIIKDDELGAKLQEKLIRKAREGVQVYVLYDEIGSHRLDKGFVTKLRSEGVKISEFQTRQGRANRFQINFRNHRKIVVVDGLSAFVGGHNVGTEYLGKSKKFDGWRDTHVAIRGPAVLSIQVIFLSDWYWACREIPKLGWQPKFHAPNDGMTLLPLPTGPTGEVEGGTLFFLTAINAARDRIWIASPYFVTDESVRSALKLAAMRGVDVRIMIPFTPDKYMPWLATFSYLVEMEAAGVRIFRYTEGFLHQKVVLVDDRMASVGTANLDNRSLRLNFEISIVVLHRDFCSEIAAMLEADFENCREIDSTDYTSRPIWFRFLVRLAQLAAPVL
ncbi:MAG: cardiolipin synthase [Verrucomicrobiales bacterium]|nr:cardiolipin synthase [Verrucomicrobiales bacterium]